MLSADCKRNECVSEARSQNSLRNSDERLINDDAHESLQLNNNQLHTSNRNRHSNNDWFQLSPEFKNFRRLLKIERLTVVLVIMTNRMHALKLFSRR